MAKGFRGLNRLAYWVVFGLREIQFILWNLIIFSDGLAELVLFLLDYFHGL